MTPPVAIGDRYGRLIVLRSAPPRRGKNKYWFCVCDCGTQKEFRDSHLRSGDTTSCGCLVREISKVKSMSHGMSYTPIYAVWNSMLRRCFCPTNKSYRHYGGRGITVCERWHRFENFFADMGEPSKGLSLDRIDNDGPYSPDNCRWANREEQQCNRRGNRRISAFGKSLTLSQAARTFSLSSNTIRMRLQVGWKAEDAVSKPKLRGRSWAQ